MLLNALASVLLLQGQADIPDTIHYLMDGKGKQYTGMTWTFNRKIPMTKLSPKTFGDPPAPLEFEWLTSAFGNPTRSVTAVSDGKPDPKNEDWKLRFAVYSQQSNGPKSKGPMVAQMLIRLWRYNYDHLRLDHATMFNNRIVNVYLCWGGQPGGEQLFAQDTQNGLATKVNTIYFYDLNSFTDPVEMAREVAHEYGHASLPPVGGFKEPEDWANGYLGEKLFLRMIRDEMAKGELAPEDAMGASQTALDAWVKANVDPLADEVALHGPDTEALAGTGSKAMNAYMGLALYASAFLPERVFSRSMLLTGSTSAKDYPAAIRLAAEEPEQVTVSVPARLAGKAIWAPIGQASVFGAKVLQRKGAWAKLQPGTGAVVFVPKRPVGS